MRHFSLVYAHKKTGNVAGLCVLSANSVCEMFLLVVELTQDHETVFNPKSCFSFHVSEVTMLTVMRSVRFGILQPTALGTAAFSGTSACLAGLPAVCCHTFPLRTLTSAGTLSGVGTTSGVKMLSGVGTMSGLGLTSGVRRLSGGGPEAVGAAGWYSSLSDSAPVHLCAQCLVSMQQVSGLPWWLSIVMATLTVRTLITLPLAAYQMVIIAKVSDIGHK